MFIHAQPACFLLMGNMVLRLGLNLGTMVPCCISVPAHCSSVVSGCINLVWFATFKRLQADAFLCSDSDAATRRCKATEPKQAIAKRILITFLHKPMLMFFHCLLVGGFNPFEKICVKLDYFSRDRVEQKKISELPPLSTWPHDLVLTHISGLHRLRFSPAT